MVTTKRPRKGSLQFWPRKRASKILPRVNWNAINSTKLLKGFIAYKVGMKSAAVKDSTPDSMTNGKEIIVPVTILECPHMKILSARFLKNKVVVSEILAPKMDKELKRKLKIPKSYSKKIDDVSPETYDDISIIAYSLVNKTGIKKTPDILELGLQGTKDEKLNFVKENLDKEFSALNYFDKGQLVDIRGITTGKGTVGPLKRFGLKLKRNKSEKGRRRPGSLGPWHPSRVTFRVPMMGQMGLFTRVNYNKHVLGLGDAKDLDIKPMKNYGNLKTDYIILTGSVQGPSKRQVVVTAPLRPTKKQAKKAYDLIELR